MLLLRSYKILKHILYQEVLNYILGNFYVLHIWLLLKILKIHMKYFRIHYIIFKMASNRVG